MYNIIAMIYTITFNPSLDFVITIEDEFNNNGVNRINTNNIYPGGKGINSSLILNRLNDKSNAIIFLDKQFGSIIENKLSIENIKFKNFVTSEFTRLNIKVNTDKNNFEINGPKITLNDNQQKEVIEYFENNLQEKDVLMIMGSLTNNKQEFFETILKTAKSKNVEFVFDIDSTILLDFLKYEPLLIKPNRDELETLFNKKIKDDEILEYGMKLKDMGAKNVLISMGSNGSVLLANNNKKYKAHPIKINMINPVAAGDSTIAGFISSFIKNNDYIDALKLGSACGTATANNE